MRVRVRGVNLFPFADDLGTMRAGIGASQTTVVFPQAKGTVNVENRHAQ